MLTWRLTVETSEWIASARADTRLGAATRAWTATTQFFTTVQKGATAVQWLFNASLWANPITWIIIGIVALVNAATTRGPLAAYRAVPHSLHMVIDVGVIVAALVGAVAVRSNAGDAVGLVALAVVQGFNLYLTRVLKKAKA